MKATRQRAQPALRAARVALLAPRGGPRCLPKRHRRAGAGAIPFPDLGDQSGGCRPIDLQPRTLTSPEQNPDSIARRDILLTHQARSGLMLKRPRFRAAAGANAFGSSRSQWMGQPEIHPRLSSASRPRDTSRAMLGRWHDRDGGLPPAPMPGNEALKSFSRVILKIGADYWAVERGRFGRQI